MGRPDVKRQGPELVDTELGQLLGDGLEPEPTTSEAWETKTEEEEAYKVYAEEIAAKYYEAECEAQEARLYALENCPFWEDDDGSV